jgi:hypothetical protein
MSRMKRINMTMVRCKDCPLYDRGGYWCGSKCDTVPDANDIPVWCPLPDAGGEAQS